ncbi:preprotein translocase subunit SecA [bacterium]|nr:preprotein translocase subunit SecA [bacterium]
MSIFSSLFGDHRQKDINALQKKIEGISSYEEKLKSLSDDEVRAKTDYFKKELQNGKTLDDILPEAFAVVREGARRTLEQRHYDVQLIGGMILHQGNITEMKTGEGKTLVGTLPVYLNALTGKGVHVVTVNDYLSQRDAVWMGQIYDFLGLSVGVIGHEASYKYDGEKEKAKDSERDTEGSYHIVHEFLTPCTRKEAYDADITYGTNNEFGFDYLRDNISITKDSVVQRGFHYAVVDEIDSILIDEARTPLIISAPIGKDESLYPVFSQIADSLKKDEDYEVDEKQRAVTLTDNGIEKAERALKIDNIYTEGGIKYVHHLETAVRAKALFIRDKDYVVRDGQVIIVDQFTGRMQPGRRWSEGLHQAVESKEGVEIQEESRTFASITFQNYFKMYKKLSGMTGTALTSAEEFKKVYGLEVLPVPTHRPIKRIDNEDLIFQTEKGKFQAIAQKIKELNEVGRPVLVGTVSIEKNELLSNFLKKEGVDHTILNAKQHEREGEIVAGAGKKGSVVIATNMAGRGVDIKLGGTDATKEEVEEVKQLGGLYVLGTERHEARRIDNQLRGRSGRQGDPGETQFFISLEDSLMRVFASDRLKNMMGSFGIPEDEPIKNKFVTRAIESAQTKIEGFHFDARRHVLDYDNVLNKQRQGIYNKRRTLLLGDENEVRAFIDNVLESQEDGEKLKEVISKKEEEFGTDKFIKVVRGIALRGIDTLWMEHLEAMDYMRGSVNLRAYGQRDPLVEYKKEGLRLFKELEQSIDDQIAKVLPHITLGVTAPLHEQKEGTAIHKSAESLTQQKTASAPKDKAGRNDPCPCGSGKKYKHCHGK